MNGFITAVVLFKNNGLIVFWDFWVSAGVSSGAGSAAPGDLCGHILGAGPQVGKAVRTDARSLAAAVRLESICVALARDEFC
jgi:hypothetical protein